MAREGWRELEQNETLAPLNAPLSMKVMLQLDHQPGCRESFPYYTQTVIVIDMVAGKVSEFS